MADSTVRTRQSDSMCSEVNFLVPCKGRLKSITHLNGETTAFAGKISQRFLKSCARVADCRKADICNPRGADRNFVSAHEQPS